MICLQSFVFDFVLVHVCVFASFDVGMGVSVQQVSNFQCDKCQLAGFITETSPYKCDPQIST